MIGAKLPHGIDNIAVMRCNVERKRDVCASTGEFYRRRPVQRLFWQGTDAKDVGQMPLLEDGREFQEEVLHWMAVERHLHSRVGELVWREALIGEAPGAGIHTQCCHAPLITPIELWWNDGALRPLEAAFHSRSIRPEVVDKCLV